LAIFCATDASKTRLRSGLRFEPRWGSLQPVPKNPTPPSASASHFRPSGLKLRPFGLCVFIGDDSWSLEESTPWFTLTFEASKTKTKDKISRRNSLWCFCADYPTLLAQSCICLNNCSFLCIKCIARDLTKLFCEINSTCWQFKRHGDSFFALKAQFTAKLTKPSQLKCNVGKLTSEKNVLL